MTHMVDIFRLDPLGVRWLESAATLESAKARVQELGVCSPGQFLVLDHKTGRRYGMQVKAAEGRSILTEVKLVMDADTHPDPTECES